MDKIKVKYIIIIVILILVIVILYRGLADIIVNNPEVLEKKDDELNSYRNG